MAALLPPATRRSDDAFVIDGDGDGDSCRKEKSPSDSFMSLECSENDLPVFEKIKDDEGRDTCFYLKKVFKKLFRTTSKTSPHPAATTIYPLDKCPYLVMHTPEVIRLEFPVNGISLASDIKVTLDPSMKMLLTVEASGPKAHHHAVRLPSVAGYNFQNASGYGLLCAGDLEVTLTQFNSQLVKIPVKSIT